MPHRRPTSKVRKLVVACIWTSAALCEVGITFLEGVGFLFNDTRTPALVLVGIFLKWQIGIVIIAMSCHFLCNRLFRLSPRSGHSTP